MFNLDVKLMREYIIWNFIVFFCFFLLPESATISKAPSTIKTNIKAGSANHPYQRSWTPLISGQSTKNVQQYQPQCFSQCRKIVTGVYRNSCK